MLITPIRAITFTTTHIPSTINTHSTKLQMVNVHIYPTKHITMQICCCLPTPLTIGSGVSNDSACGPPAILSSIWPAAPSLQQGQPQVQWSDRSAYVGEVEYMVCVVCESVTDGA